MFNLFTNGSRGLMRKSRSPYRRPLGCLALALGCLCTVSYLICFPPFLSKSTLKNALLAPSSGARQERAPFQWKDPPTRLIVFGDSSCDNGQYLIDSPPEDQIRLVQGQVWTDWLCATISCVHHDNFARPPRSSPSASSSSFSSSSSSLSPPSRHLSEIREAVIDSSLLNSTWVTQQRANHNGMVSDVDIKEPVADLRSQVQHWLAFEKTQLGTSRSTAAEKQTTIFSLCFSAWEIWYYSAGVHSNAQIAVTKSMDALFGQLDLIAENWTSDLKIVLLNAIDPTFLPYWRRTRTGPYGADSFSEDQRNAVLLTEQWNLALEKRARRWKKGVIYVYDINTWVLDNIRQGQLQNKKWGNTQNLATTETVWSDVGVSCLDLSDHLSEKAGDRAQEHTCSDPNSYLFSDDYHLGPAAMKMVGEDIAAIVLGK